MNNDVMLKDEARMEAVESKVVKTAKSKIKERKGVAATEYALVLGLIVVMMMTFAVSMSNNIKNMFTEAGNKIVKMVKKGGSGAGGAGGGSSNEGP